MPEPIITSLPSTTEAVQRKYQKLAPLLSSLPPPVQSSLLRFDTQRALRGQQPLSERQTGLVALAATTGQAQTKPRNLNLPERFVRDIGLLGASVPRIPISLFHEAKALPSLPQALSEAMSKGNLREQLTAISQAPGVRLIPGAYTVGNVLSGEGVTEHPLFTALDILPYASGAAKRTGVYRAAAEAADVAEVARPRPLPTVLTRRLTDAGIEPNRLGNIIGSGKKLANQTRPGQLFMETFGRESRDLAKLEAQTSNRLRDQLNPEGRPTNAPDPLVDLARETNNLRGRYPDITEARRIELTRAIQEASPELSAPGYLTDTERAFLDDVRDITDRYANVGVEQGFMDRIDGEIYDATAARKIRQVRARRDRAAEIATLREQVLNPTAEGALDAGSLVTSARGVLDRVDLTKKQRQQLLEGHLHALDARGYHVDEMLHVVRSVKDADKLRTYFDGWTPTAAPVADITPIIDNLTRLARTDPTAARIIDHLKAGRWQEARSLARTISRRKRYVVPDIDKAINVLSRRARRDKFLTATSSFTPKAIAKLGRRVEQVERRTAPARFQPLIQKRVDERIMAQHATPENAAEIARLIAERHYSAIPGFDQRQFRIMQRQVRETWQTMRDQGIEPVFVHRVAPNRASQINFPRVLEAIRNPTQIKARTNDITPHVQDVTVALSHQGMEWLARRGSEEFVGEMVTRWGKTLDQLREEYAPTARRLAERDPSLDFQGHLKALIDKEYVQYDPRGLITWQSPKVNALAGDQLHLPKTMANNLERMHTPASNRLTAAVDPIMHVFRTSLLPLALRWHLYNIIGGGLLLLARTDPTVFRFLGKARQMLKDGKLPEEIPHGMGSVPAEVIEWNYRAGKTMRRLVDEAGSRLPESAQGVMAGAERAGQGFSKVIQKSYDINGMFDDMYRAMAYLYGKDKALTRGMTEEGAKQAGISLTRKVMQNWDQMTPIERSVMRYVFPFYGWMNHILRYVMTYPFDHPVRVAVLGSFARNELEDMGSALPERFLNSFFLGPTDRQGNVDAINLQGMNPFSDVANYFTLAGFTGNLNPIIATALESMGLDPRTGGPELYPNLKYDPETGRLVADNPGFLGSLVQNIIPHTQVLMSLTGTSSEFKSLMRDNPEAASRMLRSQLGLPVIFRDINVPEEVFKAELARNEAQQEALRTSLRTGDDSAARQYPALAPLLAQVRQLQAQGGTSSMQPPTLPGRSKLEIAQEALLRMNLP